MSLLGRRQDSDPAKGVCLRSCLLQLRKQSASSSSSPSSLPSGSNGQRSQAHGTLYPIEECKQTTKGLVVDQPSKRGPTGLLTLLS